MASSSSVVTLASDYENQQLLLQAAAEAIPHQFDKCTYQLGSLRQHIHLCIDCKQERGLCGACSVSCHTDHTQIELFPKRNFRCDCPTRALEHPCQLNGSPTAKGKDKLEINDFNSYNQNFRDGGRFCRCHSLYDGEKERETMVQCLACEDWFHESCLNLRERVPPRDEAGGDSPQSSLPASNPSSPEDTTKTDIPATEDDVAPSQGRFWDYEGEDDEDDDPSIPKALIPASEYDAFVCGDCLLSSPMLLKWAGSAGARMVVRSSSTSDWIIYAGGPQPVQEANETTDDGEIGQKRSREQVEEPTSVEGEPPSKKPRLESAKECAAPTPDPQIQQLLDRIKAHGGPYLEGDGLHGAGDIFFTPGWRERWCRCKDCSLQLASRSYLEEEEETYELPEDPDAGLSLEELGMKALNNLPRDQAIEGIRAFQTMSAELNAFLAPFAQEGKVVTAQDVHEFFESRRKQLRKP